MQTEQATYLDFLGTPRTKMKIPVFQRVYTWGTWQCEELLEDILNAGRSGEDHFIGSIVYTHETAHGACPFDKIYNIVDGQQRTTTMYLLLIALRDLLAKTKTSAGGLDAHDIDNRFLYLAEEEERVAKFIAAPADRETLEAILEKTEMPVSYKISKSVVDNYHFFADKIANGTDLDELVAGLNNLFAIIIKLESEDNPQLIFEGINSKGMSLATGDLLRNKLFYGNDDATQERLLETYWEPLEALFADDHDQTNFNAALRCWLVEQDPSLSKHTRYELYSVFRKYINERYEGTTEELLGELLESCKVFKSMIKSPPMKKHLDWAQGNNEVEGHKIFGPGR